MRPALRISFGIVALTTSLLLVSDSLLTIFPDPNDAVLEARKDLSESLAVQYSSLISNARHEQMQPAMQAIVAQMPDVLSMSLLKADGEQVAGTEEHASLWEDNEQTSSTPTQVLIPIFHGDQRWGTLQVKFAELPYAGLLGLLSHPLYKLIAIMGALGFFAYLLYLSRTLRYLDPSTVVPGRVRAALDQLVEGAFILDHDLRIVLVNSAFARKVGRGADELMGVDPSVFNWSSNTEETPADELPWVAAMRDGARRTDVRLELESPSLGRRVLTSNVSPISDDGGKQRGVLATFDDISEVEKSNQELRDALSELEEVNAEVQVKNDELFRLSRIDPLTECLNRRALFEKIEAEFKLAGQENLELSVVMADIDHFKRVNDDFGHAVGDAVIEQMACILGQSTRANDCVGRYGGEEFCMVLVHTGVDGAMAVSERARLAVEEMSSASDSPTNGRKITASFGVSTTRFGATDIAELLNQADLALYESKNGGRNRVTCWSALPVHQDEAV